MRVYVLLFESPSALTRAFDLVLERDDLMSCAVEPESSRLRFLAPRKVGDELVQRIYQDGGLTWCSRHAFEGAPS